MSGAVDAVDMKPATAVGYVRVSTGRQEDSIEAQGDVIQCWCVSEGVELLQTFSETISAGKPLAQRVGVLDAISAVERHKADHLIAVARDRLGRDAIEMAVIERMLVSAGAQLTTTDGASSATGPEGALIRTILDAVAQFERIQISVRTRRVIQHKRERGEKFTGHPPYGKRTEGQRFVYDAGEQKVIALVCLHRHQGKTWAAICAVLTASKFRPRGDRWHSTTVRRIWAAAKIDGEGA